MLDIKIIREEPEKIKTALKKVGDVDSVDIVLELDKKRRKLLGDIEKLRNERNIVSKEIGIIKDNKIKQDKIIQMKAVNKDIKEIETSLENIEKDYKNKILSIPNIPDENVPEGSGEADNIVISTYGEIPKYDFDIKPHWELGEQLGGIDFERGVKISGTRFYILKNDFARLQRALITYMLDLHTQENGFTEVYTPFMVKEFCMYGTGQLPKFGENLYKDIEEDFYFIPTAEVPVTNMYNNEILDSSLLPIKHVAFTACFRREKMSAGKDTRGIKRGHQFDKVEMVAFTLPEDSNEMLENITNYAAKVLENLKLPYRKLQICTGDLSFTAAAKYDLEVWSVGCEEWLEVSSISNFKDFQARRANIKFRRKQGEKPEFVHTLNGSGLALPRVMIAIIENYQTSDGKIRIPEVLQTYLGGQKEIG